MSKSESYVQYRKDVSKLNKHLRRFGYTPMTFAQFVFCNFHKVTGRPTLVTNTKWWKPFQKLEWAVDSWWIDGVGNTVCHTTGSLRFVNVID